jgi:hypothetical protein
MTSGIGIGNAFAKKSHREFTNAINLISSVYIGMGDESKGMWRMVKFL